MVSSGTGREDPALLHSQSGVYIRISVRRGRSAGADPSTPRAERTKIMKNHPSQSRKGDCGHAGIPGATQYPSPSQLKAERLSTSKCISPPPRTGLAPCGRQSASLEEGAAHLVSLYMSCRAGTVSESSSYTSEITFPRQQLILL